MSDDDKYVAEEVTRITKITVSVRRDVKADLGYTDEFRSYVEEMLSAGRSIPFGMRNNSSVEHSVFMSAVSQVSELDSPYLVISDVADKLRAAVDLEFAKLGLERYAVTSDSSGLEISSDEPEFPEGEF